MYYFIKFFFFLISVQSFCQSENLIDDFRKYKTTKSSFNLSKISGGLNYPWGLTFIDSENLIVTEKNGKIKKINITNGKVNIIQHNISNLKYRSDTSINGQGGLLDVLYHDQYLYFSYSRSYEKINGKKVSSTEIARGKLINDRIENLEILISTEPKLEINKHWGSRLVIKNNFLFAGFGDRGLGMIAQDPSTHPGSIIRINLDGTIPNDNPGLKKFTNWLPEIITIGVRNPQGIAISPHDGEIYFSQHGPRGGDNIGKIFVGGNYGWKDIAWGGREYFGPKIGDSAFKEKYNKPIISWVPSIGVGQIAFYSGDTFKEWEGDLIGSAAQAGLIFRLNYQNGKIIDKEIILQGDIGRIRDFEIDEAGDFYVVVDDKDSFLWKISK